MPLEPRLVLVEDDAGRIYVRASRGGSTWEALLSHKAEQDRDIAWLRSLS